MNRLRALLLVGLLVALAASSAASGQRTQPVLRRPNPLYFVSQSLDYVNPIKLPNGTLITNLAPLAKTAINTSVADLKYLEYARSDDLGGFIPAPLGWLATGTCPPQKSRPVGCPGRALLGKNGKSKVPFYSNNNVRGKFNGYTWPKGTAGGGNKKNCVACGILPPGGPFTNVGPTFPANGGFGGPTNPPHNPKPPKPVTKGSAGDCGTAGISIVSNLPKCRIYVVNQEPGDSASEQLTITNTTNVRYVLSFEATGTPNRLWQDLEMGVWERGTPAPTPLPALHFWTDQYNDLVTLAPGQVIHYTIELYLPLTSGNQDQNLPAIIDFHWRAVQKS